MENSTFYPVNDYRYLAHHGVKGMKWGVRRQKMYEAKRKAKYMDKYGITSKQYDSVRKKSLARHTTGNKVRNIYRGFNAVATVGNVIRNNSNAIDPSQQLGPLGAAAAVGLSDALARVEWHIGRSIVDWAIESPEYEEMARKRND